MESERTTRRDFVRNLARGGRAGRGTRHQRKAADDPPAQAKADTSKILNYNPDMEYRRQGKTGLMVSAVCLGGHSRSNDQERTEIISRCIDLGINYIDACSDFEVKRNMKALAGRRDKMYLALSHCAKRCATRITVRPRSCWSPSTVS